jgi:two-component system, OmpR family, response regulator RegX3
MSRILVVEDDTHVAASLRDLLERDGHDVTLARTIAEAESALDAAIELVLLDWMLPDGQGVDALKVWRRRTDVPVILVTARADVVDRVVGLEIGADDYVTKPFEGRELLARIKARLRGRGAGLAEAASTKPQRLEHAGVSIDLETRETRLHGKSVELTRMEFGLLRLLVEHPGRVFTREELLNRVWGYERAPTTRTVDAHVLTLRTKLFPELIESMRGIGYRCRKN